MTTHELANQMLAAPNMPVVFPDRFELLERDKDHYDEVASASIATITYCNPYGQQGPAEVTILRY